MARSDWIVRASKDRRIYNNDPLNRESLTGVECINGTRRDISPMLILTGISILAPFFLKDLSDNVLITTAEPGYSNDWLALQWIKHFDKHSRNIRKGAWRLLIMDGHGSHHTREFLEYCDAHNIIPFGLPSLTTHLLQPLDVCMFQPLKHWHSEAINKAIQNGDETFSKVEFLAAFNTFRAEAFKSTTITSAYTPRNWLGFRHKLLFRHRGFLSKPNPDTKNHRVRHKRVGFSVEKPDPLRGVSA